MQFGNKDRDENLVPLPLVGSPEEMARQLVRHLDNAPDIIESSRTKKPTKNPGIEIKVVLDKPNNRALFISELSSLLIGCGYDFRLTVIGESILLALPLKNNF